MTRKIVRDLVAQRVLLVEDGNHGEYRPRPDEFVDVGVPFIRAADMSSGTINFDSAGKINTIARNRIRKGIGNPGDVILSHKGTVGRVAVAPMDSPNFVCSPQTTFWRSLDLSVLNQRFLRYAMLSPSFARQLEVLKGQTDMAPYVSLTDQRSIELELPPIEVQRAVAKVLGALDDKIAANDKAFKISRDLAHSNYVRATRAGDRLTIREVAQLVARGVTPKYVESDGVTILNQKCVRNQWINLNPSRMTKESSIRSDKLLHRYDVLVNSTGAGTLGRVARWTLDIRATADSHVTIVRFDPTLIDPVCAGFGLLQIEKEVEGLAEGSTGQTELRRDLLAGLEIAVPDKAIQKSIGAELTALDELALGLQQESDILAATRDEILPLLMSGKIRVREAEKVVEGIV
ncbi:restriction endonuclease subunit S [Amycolatopsis sp. cg5]|uniref:restriction endonuclease subunit S n=1 Tax=Amycolatopsis sp. cg5 TaxID=3238802 RepID=UPI00352354FE